MRKEQKQMVELSVVIPVYGCPEALMPLYDRLKNTLEQITSDYEIILVNDACPKGSWEIIKKICESDKKVIGINLSRNFGQIHSTNAGILHSTGEKVVLMDCDLQDRPEDIIELNNEFEKGYDIVFARRKNRKDNALTLFFSKAFYKIYNQLIDGYYDGEVGNFCIANRKIIDIYNSIKDNNKCFTMVLSWMGFKTSYIDLQGDKRFEGKSSYSFSKKVGMAIDIVTSQSNKPLKVIIVFGLFIALMAFIFLTVQIFKRIIYNDVPEGWTSIIASIFLMGGIILICMGGIGIYVGNIFNQTKGNPEFLINEILNCKEDSK